MARAFVPHHISDDSALGGSVIKNSLRLNRGDNTYLQATLGNSNLNKWTLSIWVKKPVNGEHQAILASGDSSVYTMVNFGNSDRLKFTNYPGSNAGIYITTRKFRDPSAWYHIVAIWDSGNSTAGDRMRLYVNGVRETAFDQSDNPNQNQNSVINGNTQGGSTWGNGKHRIGRFSNYADNSGCYYAEVNFVDGIALDPSYFGYTDFQTGLWRPKKYEGSYNTNGFHLEFKNTSVNPTYTVPTTSFTNDSDTALLINNNESNGSTTFTDSSSNGYSISGTGSIAHSTAQAKFGSSSILFDGSDDSLSVGGNSTLYGNLTTSSNQTYEAFVYHSANDYTYLFSSSSNQRYLGMYINASSGHFGFNGNYPNPYTAVRADVTIPLNQWNHFFVQRNADGTMTVGFNGSILQNSVAEGANNSNSGTIGPLKIGSQHYYGSTHRYFFEGYMDEIRISNTPRYSAVYVDSVGDDTSGQGNNFVPINFQSSDVLTDAPTNNFATLDVLAESGGTYSEGNLKVVSTADSASSTIGFASGKFYYEVYVDATSAMYVGVIPIDFGLNPARGGSWDHGAIAYKFNGDQYSLKQGQSSVSASYGASYTAGDIIGCAVDIDNDTVTFYKNGVSQGNTTNGVSYISPTGAKDGIYGAIVYCNGGNNIMIVNYGQDSTFQGTVSAGGNKDASGLGDFKYPVPSGYRALCSNNLPVNTTSLINPKKHFDTLLWTGNGSASHRITGLEFKPDLVWLKCRSHTKWFILVDSVRGNSKNISSNDPSAEFTETHIPSFNVDGITVADIDSGTANENTYTYVAWCWKAGGAAVSNSDGSITSSVSANQEAGFSIVTFTGTGSAATVGHGLSKAPDVVITKRRNAAQAWFTHHKDLSNGHYLRLDATNAQGGDTNVYPNNMSTTNTFAVGGDDGVNGNGSTYVSYCWHSVPGYSKFGTYEGNGNANGPFVFTGFRPAMIFYKRIDGSDNWGIHDNKRDVDNPIQRFLYPDDTYAEWTGGTNDHFDFLSNGFKIRNAGSMLNQNNETMVYWAFAEQPGSTTYATETNAR